MADFYTLPPAPSCVICGNTLEKIGGRRIVAQKARGFAISNKRRTKADYDNFITCDHLSEDNPKYFVVWGEPERMTDEVIERIRQTFLAGLRPWGCSAYLCFSSQCRSCGKGNNWQHGSSIIYSDGIIKYCWIVPADLGCSNCSCTNFRDMEDGWEVMQVDGKRSLN
jgi:hypothetical protein